MVDTILQLVLVGAKIFSEERQRYYQKQVENLHKEIQEVEDSVFLKKDQNKKGKAERALLTKKEALAAELITESKGKA